MCESDSISSSHIKIVYYDNKRSKVDETNAFRKIISYYDNDNNYIRAVMKIRFSLDKDW